MSANPQRIHDIGTPQAAPAKADTVSALERGIGILRCFNEQTPALSHVELERITGIPRPTVVRLVATLMAQGLLRHAPGGERFMLGAGIISLARVFLSSLDVRAVARTPMQDLADDLGGSLYLAIREGLDIVLIEACRARSSLLTPRLDVGSRAPLANSALGRACLIAMPASQRQRLLDSLAMGRGADWVQSSAALGPALAAGRAAGYCLSIGEFHRDINSVAVPIIDAHGDVMAINFGGAAFDFPAERLIAEVAPRIVALAESIAAQIGGRVATSPD